MSAPAAHSSPQPAPSEAVAMVHAGHGALEDGAGAEAPPSHATRAGPCEAREDLRPVCPCGCGERRARVGGVSSRLGATIPAVHVAALLPDLSPRGPSQPQRLLPSPLLAADPVPI